MGSHSCVNHFRVLVAIRRVRVVFDQEGRMTLAETEEGVGTVESHVTWPYQAVAIGQSVWEFWLLSDQCTVLSEGPMGSGCCRCHTKLLSGHDHAG